MKKNSDVNDDIVMEERDKNITKYLQNIVLYYFILILIGCIIILIANIKLFSIFLHVWDCLGNATISTPNAMFFLFCRYERTTIKQTGKQANNFKEFFHTSQQLCATNCMSVNLNIHINNHLNIINKCQTEANNL